MTSIGNIKVIFLILFLGFEVMINIITNCVNGDFELKVNRF